MHVLVVIARIIHRSTLYFAVARNLVYENNTWGKKHLTGRKCQVYTKKNVENSRSHYLKRRGRSVFIE